MTGVSRELQDEKALGKNMFETKRMYIKIRSIAGGKVQFNGIN